MKLIVDRIEGEIAVIELENGDFVDVPKKILPNKAGEGSIINITCDEKDTQVAREEVKKKMNSIFHK